MNKEKALSLAAAICSKKEHCSWEIQEKLVKWEIPEKEIDRIMTFLHQHRFIDDARYAQAYAEDKFRFNHWGKQKIALMLHRKKIDPDLISQVLEALDTDTYQEACLTLLKQKMKSLAGEEPYKRKAKLIRFGLSRGFGYEVIDRASNAYPVIQTKRQKIRRNQFIKPMAPAIFFYNYFSGRTGHSGSVKKAPPQEGY